MLINKLIILLFLSCSVLTFKAEGAQVYYVYLKDKSCNTHLKNKPNQILSDKAILRRAKQNIPIVENDLPICNSYINSIKYYSSKVLGKSKWLNMIMVESSEVDKIRQLEMVERVEIPHQLFSDLKDLPKETVQYRFSYGSSLDQIGLNEGNCLHNQGFTGKNISIAVMDAGFAEVDQISQFNHLFRNEQLLGTYDFVNDEEDVYKK